MLAESLVSEDVVGWLTGTTNNEFEENESDNEPSKSISKPDAGAAPLVVRAAIYRLQRKTK